MDQQRPLPQECAWNTPPFAGNGRPALKQWQEAMANRIVSQCDTLYVEKMNFKSLQRRAKNIKS